MAKREGLLGLAHGESQTCVQSLRSQENQQPWGTGSWREGRRKAHLRRTIVISLRPGHSLHKGYNGEDK